VYLREEAYFESEDAVSKSIAVFMAAHLTISILDNKGRIGASSFILAGAL
jgi:hypothetical protein